MASMPFTILVSLFIILCFPFFLKFLLKPKIEKNLRSAVKLPPGPPRLPIIGNLHQLGKLPHKSLWQLSQKYGPVMLLQLGSVPTLVISSAVMAKEVLQTQDSNFCSRPYSPGPRRLSYNFLDVAFSPYGDHWRKVRKVFVSAFHNPKLTRRFSRAREAEVNHLVESILEESPNPVNLDEKIFNLMDGIICAVAFGKSYGVKRFKGHDMKGFLKEAMLMLDSYSAEDYFPSIGWAVDALTGQRARLEKFFVKLDGFFETVIDEHLHQANTPKGDSEDIVDSLLTLSKDDTAALHLSKNQIKAIILNTFLGGTDTSAVTMVWAMTQIVKNPRVMQKLQTEIRDNVGKRPRVEADDLSKLTYLRMVVKETLRLHSPVPLLLPHESISHCKLGSGVNRYDICPKTKVFVNAWAIGRDPGSWKNPNEFYPERFEENNIDFGGQHFELLPFGAGRRICPGITDSIPTIELTLANLLHCFDWEMPNGMKEVDISLEEEGGLVTRKKTPLCLVPIKPNWQE